MTEPVDNHHACQACHPPLTLPQLGHHFTVAGRQISARITSRSIMVRAFLCFCTALAQSAEPTESAAEIAARASQAMEAKDYVRAEALTRTAVRMDPEFAEGWVALGLSLWWQERQAEAQAAFEEALGAHSRRFEKDPTDSNQLLQQVFVLVLLGREQDALTQLRSAKARFPKQASLDISEDQVSKWRQLLDEELGAHPIAES